MVFHLGSEYFVLHVQLLATWSRVENWEKSMYTRLVLWALPFSPFLFFFSLFFPRFLLSRIFGHLGTLQVVCLYPYKVDAGRVKTILVSCDFYFEELPVEYECGKKPDYPCQFTFRLVWNSGRNSILECLGVWLC